VDADGGLSCAFLYETKGDGGGRRSLTGAQLGACLASYLPVGRAWQMFPRHVIDTRFEPSFID